MFNGQGLKCEMRTEFDKFSTWPPFLEHSLILRDTFCLVIFFQQTHFLQTHAHDRTLAAAAATAATAAAVTVCVF